MTVEKHLTLNAYLDMVHSYHFVSQEWKAEAECIRLLKENPQYDPLDWFPETKKIPEHVAAACAECPVRLECLCMGIWANEQHGVWGGRLPHQIKTLRTRIRIAVRKRNREQATRDRADASMSPPS